MPNLDSPTREAAALLERLIATPSVSRDEKAAADLLQAQMERWGLRTRREANNVWTTAADWREGRPTLLLNAHIDTVKPVASWTRQPFAPTIDGDRLYGLGSNDCGGGLVSLLAAFRQLAGTGCAYNLIYLASAEEEVSGANGICRTLPLLPHIDVAIVGEPTAMQPAIAEKGLMVIDATAHGRSGHAARGEGINAIYEALDDLLWLRSYRFGRVSPLLGPTMATATVISSGTQHNVVPDTCRFTIDVRTNELYSNEEAFDIIDSHTKSEMKARSFRLGSSVAHRPRPSARGPLQGHGHDAVRLAHAVRPGTHAIPLAEARPWRLCPLPLRRRVHLPRRDKPRHQDLRKTAKGMMCLASIQHTFWPGYGFYTA